MRLFVAADLDNAAREAAIGTSRAIARGFDQAGIAMRWIPAEQLHFSLRFLGEVDADMVTRTRQALAGPWETPSFDAGFDALDVFPYSGVPRVVWLGMGAGREALFAVKTELDRRLGQIGVAQESRVYRPHLTLGRVRRQAEPPRAAVKPLLGDAPVADIRWVIDAVTLYESRVSYRGASYRVVERFPLPRGESREGQP